MRQIVKIAADSADRLTKVLVILLIAALVTIITLEVICRYVLKIPMVWSEQLACFVMVWLAFLSAAIAFRQGAHIGMTLLSSRLTGLLQKAVMAISHLLVLFFLFFLAWWGIKHSMDVSSERSPVVFNISMMWPYLAIPIGALLMIVQEFNVIFTGYEIVPDDIDLV
jgi:TRAP-type C4-dicarboxylate transport system permease small subunit